MNYHIKIYFYLVIIVFPSLISAQYQVGHYNITFEDPRRANRNIDTEIYYPATISGDSTLTAIGEFPVIIFGHGFVMTWDAYQNLWEEFVPKGYIMVFPKTEGSLFSTNHQEFGWDLQFLVTKIQDEGQNIASPIYNIVGPQDGEFKLRANEVKAAAELISKEAHPEANIIFGQSSDPTLKEEVRLTVIATGFPESEFMYNTSSKSENSDNTVIPEQLDLDLPPFLRNSAQ